MTDCTYVVFLGTDDHGSLKMIRSSREEETSSAKQELVSSNEKVQITSSRVWSSALKNPRIVRVGRAFGGKDRHSKVTTVKGLRDRRIRLSVPTAIQLYDLQDKLGLSQPSKVVDWLLNAAQHEIDKLPPLQMPPESFMQFPHQPRAASRRKAPAVAAGAAEAPDFFHGIKSSQQLAPCNGNFPAAAVQDGHSALSKSSIWSSNAVSGIKGKESMRDQLAAGVEKSGGLLMSNAMSHGAYYQLEPSNSINLMSHLSAAEVPHGHHLIPKQYSHFQMIHLAAEGFHDPNPFRVSQQQSADSSNFLVLQPNYIFRSHAQDHEHN